MRLCPAGKPYSYVNRTRATRRTPGPSRRRVPRTCWKTGFNPTVREGVVSGRPDVATHPVGRGSQPTGHRADELNSWPRKPKPFKARSMSSRRRTKKQRCWVATADGKGVPMRRPLEERIRSGHRRGKGEKANKKQRCRTSGVGVQYRPFSSYGRRCCGRSATPASSGLGTARNPSTNSSGPR